MTEKLRVYQLAKEMLTDSKVILRVLRQIGAEAKNHMSTLDEEVAEKVRGILTGKLKLTEAAKTPASEGARPQEDAAAPASRRPAAPEKKKAEARPKPKAPAAKKEERPPAKPKPIPSIN